MAAVLTWIFFKPSFPSLNADLYPTYLTLGVLLPSLFVILALSVRYTGIVKTDVAQRLSLFIPVLAAFLIFGEEHSLIKIAGILIAFLAIICSIPWQKGKAESSGWIYPIIVFVGMGIIDILFKQIARAVAIPFTSSLLIVFSLAFAFSILCLMYLLITGKIKLTLINVLCGWILGIANFGNIVFYLKAHQALAEQPSLVFSSMNIGVILLGSLVGVLIFREKLTRLNYAGIALALISIVIMSIA
jgi:drug/metabolite transporter (DMT)-like permease